MERLLIASGCDIVSWNTYRRGWGRIEHKINKKENWSYFHSFFERVRSSSQCRCLFCHWRYASVAVDSVVLFVYVLCPGGIYEPRACCAQAARRCSPDLFPFVVWCVLVLLSRGHLLALMLLRAYTSLSHASSSVTTGWKKKKRSLQDSSQLPWKGNRYRSRCTLEYYKQLLCFYLRKHILYRVWEWRFWNGHKLEHSRNLIFRSHGNLLVVWFLSFSVTFYGMQYTHVVN